MELLVAFGSNGAMMTYAAIGGTVLIGVFLFVCWVRYSDLKTIYSQEKVYIEVTPPIEVSKSPAATEQFFHNLHSVGSTKRFRHRVLRRNTIFSLEVVSSRNEGVRFVVGTSTKEADALERAILAYLSSTKVKRISDPLIERTSATKVKEFKQTKHFALPIRTLDTFEQHDPVAFIAGAINRLAKDEQVALQLVIAPARVRNMATIVQRYREFYKVSEATHNKAYGQLFKTELRVRVVARNDSELITRMNSVESAISSFNIPKVQTLKARYNFPEFIRGRMRQWKFEHRMPSFIHRNSNILSSLELANIFHFPSDITASENVAKSLSRTLAAPLSLKQAKDFNVVIGKTNHYGETHDIGLTRDERARHCLVIGKTGSGKTTMLEYEILQDIENGEGVIFIDPHGDAAESILGKIPAERFDDVVYFNPDDIDFPPSLNMLEIPEDVTGNELLRQKDLVTETMITVFRKVFSEGEDGGSRIESALRNTIQTALTLKNPTIFTLNKIINDPKFRKKVVADLQDENLRDYWLNEVGEAGGMQRVKMMQGITTKLGRFLFAASAKRILDHPKSTIDFNDILNSRKILICNLSKGRIGEDTSQLFGVMILAKIQMAALNRARLAISDRSPCYIYVDEFQNFATPSFVELLAEARKYGISMNMAQQTLSQQKDQNIINTIVANSGTTVIFQTVSLDDERYIGHLFHPYIEPSEIQNLPAYHFYARLSAIRSQEPISGQTIVPPQKYDKNVAAAVIESSRSLYARPFVAETAQELARAPETKKSMEDSPTKKRVQTKRVSAKKASKNDY